MSLYLTAIGFELVVHVSLYGKSFKHIFIYSSFD